MGRVGTTFAGAILGATREFVAGRTHGAVSALQLPSKDQSRSHAVCPARFACGPASRRGVAGDHARRCARERTCARGRLSVLTPRWSGDDRMLVRRGISARRQKQRRRCQAPSRLLSSRRDRAATSERSSQPVRQQCDEHDPRRLLCSARLADIAIELATFRIRGSAGLSVAANRGEQPRWRQAIVWLRLSREQRPTAGTSTVRW